MAVDDELVAGEAGGAEIRALRVPVSAPTALFDGYCGTKPLRFANRFELDFARTLDRCGVQWDYEPRTFALDRTADGRVIRAFTPDFYLPEHELFIEVTAMKQSRVARKNRKARELRELYPNVRFVLFYRRDLERAVHRLAVELLPALERRSRERRHWLAHPRVTNSRPLLAVAREAA
jgi:hypothetical protein